MSPPIGRGTLSGQRPGSLAADLLLSLVLLG
jgi:hypothetical protein